MYEWWFFEKGHLLPSVAVIGTLRVRPLRLRRIIHRLDMLLTTQ